MNHLPELENNSVSCGPTTFRGNWFEQVIVGIRHVICLFVISWVSQHALKTTASIPHQAP
jgi:hypothetical protein